MYNDKFVNNNAMPLISVIIPVLNCVDHIEYAIKSVIDQIYTNVELIIIDGKSTDGTLEVIKKYEKKIACWISEPDQGIYDAMNKGVNLAHGEWLYFMGADDVLLNILHKIIHFFVNKQTIYYGDVYCPTKHKIYGGEFDAKKLGNKNIPHQAIFYPKCVFDKYMYDIKYQIWADYHFNIRCFGDKAYQFKYLKTLIAIYNDRGKSSNMKDSQFKKDYINILETNLGDEIGFKYLLRKKIKQLRKDFKQWIRSSNSSKFIDKD